MNTLRKYIILCFVFTAVSHSNITAQIIYTDISPDTTISATTDQQLLSYLLDIDNDGNHEFEFRHFNPEPGEEAVELHGEIIGNKEVVVNVNNHSRLINQGESIGPNTTSWGNDMFGILDTFWYGEGDKYFGFRFKRNSQWHYAWARIHIPADRLSFTVKDYAFDQTPGAAINAGEGMTLTGETEIETSLYGVQISPNPFRSTTILRLPNLTGSIRLELWNATGECHTINYKEPTTEIVINRDDLNSGVYYYQLFCTDKVYSGKLIISN